ncbi:hypothetical protein [Polaromonas sp.]|uniref:hypothetical protein n=1 Tax=Polaromonas sp. TaxID=1869339 RepID=UPI0017F45741|nr:hypothetical protein [Polaromonas sp.]NML84511.1 hypothetical protein [Polaromonas sp.]
MSFFNWFSGKNRQTRHTTGGVAIRAGEKPAIALPQRLVPDTRHSEGERKVKRHARREQMYVAIREAMTRAGVLSASYKFKVLSLDQGGHEFLVMMDLEKVVGDPTPQLGAIEALIVQGAKLRFEITVPAVYWRLHELPAAGKPVLQGAIPAASGRQLKAATSQHQPIQPDEVAAFQQALLSACARGPAEVAGNGVKMRSGFRSPAPPLHDFEDTEMTEAASSPALSNTQYGELN